MNCWFSTLYHTLFWNGNFATTPTITMTMSILELHEDTTLLNTARLGHMWATPGLGATEPGERVFVTIGARGISRCSGCYILPSDVSGGNMCMCINIENCNISTDCNIMQLLVGIIRLLVWRSWWENWWGCWPKDIVGGCLTAPCVDNIYAAGAAVLVFSSIVVINSFKLRLKRVGG